MATPQSEADDAITAAWKDAGGAKSVLGDKQDDVYPATGANAVESAIGEVRVTRRAVDSDLGFPTTNEADGGIPTSRISTFSAADNPVIFWTHNHGAFVVGGAMKAAWEKLGGERANSVRRSATRPSTVTLSRRNSPAARSPGIGRRIRSPRSRPTWRLRYPA